MLWGLAVDMFEINDHLVVKAAMRGVKLENLDNAVQGETLTIKGETGEEQEKKAGHNYPAKRAEQEAGPYRQHITPSRQSAPHCWNAA